MAVFFFYFWLCKSHEKKLQRKEEKKEAKKRIKEIVIELLLYYNINIYIIYTLLELIKNILTNRLTYVRLRLI